MTTNSIALRMQQRRDTYANFMASDPVLLTGEIAVVKNYPSYNGVRLKIGDGRSVFSELPWFEDPSKLPINERGAANGIVPLGPDGRVPIFYLRGTESVKIIPVPPSQINVPAYDGNEHSPEMSTVENGDGLIETGTMFGVDAGDYTLAYKPRPGYAWADGSTGTVFVTWQIAPQKIAPPTLVDESFVYNGEPYTPTWNGVDSSKMSISGEQTGTNAGSYQTIFTITDTNYEF